MKYTDAIKRALALAERGTGYVSPNPRVGAVILDMNGKVIGEGWHKAFGGNHAEVEAINSAKRDSFEGCTMVCTLEPCSHYGKTPPCSDLIIEKKFSKVVIGTLDKNPLVAGKGVEKLRQAGIDVEIGVEEEKCIDINRFFFKYSLTDMPYVILKIAQSLDGNIALKNGQSKWITSEESRHYGQKLRSEADAILVGRNTVLVDNPLLTVRDFDLPNPKKIILDSNLSLPLDLNILKSEERQNTIIFCNERTANIRKANTLSLAGIKIEPISDQNNSGFLDLKSVLKVLGNKYQINSILVEGGSQVLSSFIAENLFDEIHFFIAPKIIGSGLQSFGHFHLNSLDKSPKLKIVRSEIIGGDFHIIAKLI